MFGFIAKMPKLAIIGFIVLLIGFGPEILATVNIDTVGPGIALTSPSGNVGSETPWQQNVAQPIWLFTYAGDVDVTSGRAYISPGGLMGGYGTETIILDPVQGDIGKFAGEYTPTYLNLSYEVTFQLKDEAGNISEVTRWAEAGDAEGDFYIKDGDDPGYIAVWEDAILTFNHRTLYFKFLGGNNWEDITRVWIDIIDETSFDLDKGTGNEWNGSTWTAPSDGTYTINGYFRAFSQDWQGMSILVGSGEDPVPPTPWTTYDWLKILGVGLIVVGFIWKK